MKQSYIAIISFFLGCALTLAIPALGASGQSGKPATVVASGYDYDSQTAAFRTGVATIDTATKAIILATPEFLTGGKPTITVSARFSVSGATCGIRLVHINKITPDGSSSASANNYIKGVSSEVTLTAGTVQFEGTYYPAPDYFFDSEGSSALRIIVSTAPSSGTVDLWVGSN